VSLIFIPTGTITELTPCPSSTTSTHFIVNNTKEAELVAQLVIGFRCGSLSKMNHLWGHSKTQEVITIHWHQMTDGTKKEDDTLSGGSELITLCLGSIHKSIVANELALKRNVNL